MDLTIIAEAPQCYDLVAEVPWQVGAKGNLNRITPPNRAHVKGLLRGGRQGKRPSQSQDMRERQTERLEDTERFGGGEGTTPWVLLFHRKI